MFIRGEREMRAIVSIALFTLLADSSFAQQPLQPCAAVERARSVLVSSDVQGWTTCRRYSRLTIRWDNQSCVADNSGDTVTLDPKAKCEWNRGNYWCQSRVTIQYDNRPNSPPFTAWLLVFEDDARVWHKRVDCRGLRPR